MYDKSYRLSTKVDDNLHYHENTPFFNQYHLPLAPSSPVPSPPDGLKQVKRFIGASLDLIGFVLLHVNCQHF